MLGMSTKQGRDNQDPESSITIGHTKSTLGRGINGFLSQVYQILKAKMSSLWRQIDSHSMPIFALFLICLKKVQLLQHLWTQCENYMKIPKLL